MEWTVVTITHPSLIMRKAWNVSRLPTSAVNVLIFPESPATARCHHTGRMSKSGPWSASPSLSRQLPMPEYSPDVLGPTSDGCHVGPWPPIPPGPNTAGGIAIPGMTPVPTDPLWHTIRGGSPGAVYPRYVVSSARCGARPLTWASR